LFCFQTITKPLHNASKATRPSPSESYYSYSSTETQNKENECEMVIQRNSVSNNQHPKSEYAIPPNQLNRECSYTTKPMECKSNTQKCPKPLPSESDDSHTRNQNVENDCEMVLQPSSLSNSRNSASEYAINSNPLNSKIHAFKPKGYMNYDHLCALISIIQALAQITHYFPEEWIACIKNSKENSLIKLIAADINHEFLDRFEELNSLDYFRKENSEIFTRDEILLHIFEKILVTIKEESVCAQQLFNLDITAECSECDKRNKYAHIWTLDTLSSDKPEWCQVKDCPGKIDFHIENSVKVMFVRLRPTIETNLNNSVESLHKLIPLEINNQFTICSVLLYESAADDGTKIRHFSCLRENFARPSYWWYCSDRKVQPWSDKIKSGKFYFILCLRRK